MGFFANIRARVRAREMSIDRQMDELFAMMRDGRRPDGTYATKREPPKRHYSYERHQGKRECERRRRQRWGSL